MLSSHAVEYGVLEMDFEACLSLRWARCSFTNRFHLGFGSGPACEKLFEKIPSTMHIPKALAVAQQTEIAGAAKTITSVSVKEEPVYRATGERRLVIVFYTWKAFHLSNVCRFRGI